MHKILHIDRDEAGYKIIDIALGDEYLITHVNSGFAAFSSMETDVPELVVTDLDLPMMDGFEIMERIRGDERLKRLPIVVLSEEKNVVTEEKAAQYGVVEFIKKPFVPSMLKMTIDRALSTIHRQNRMADELHEVKDKARRDALTDLWNREYASSLIDSMLFSNVAGALFMIDMDNFKAINDTYGHDAGDKTLIMFAETLKSHMRERDVAARIGGDEFIAFVAGPHDRSALATLAGRIIQELSAKLDDFHFETNTSVSLGISIFGIDGTNYEELKKAADAALYNVKQNGKKGYRFACDEKEEDEVRSSSLLNANNIHEILTRHDDEKNKVFSPGLLTLSSIYQYISRQNVISAVPVLFTISSPVENVQPEEKWAKAADVLEEILHDQLRRTDAMARYSRRQFLVITLDTDADGILPLVDRIIETFNAKIEDGSFTISFEIGKRATERIN